MGSTSWTPCTRQFGRAGGTRSAGGQLVTRLAFIVLALIGSAQAGLAQTGSISGTVTEHVSNAPLANITVRARGLDNYWSSTATAANGQYTITGLPAGDYWVETQDDTGTHVGQIYDGMPWISWCLGCSAWGGGGDRVAVTAGQTKAGIDFVLAVGGHVSGQLKDAATTNPVANVTVCINDGEPWYCT